MLYLKAIALIAFACITALAFPGARKEREEQVMHDVYFSLKDSSAAARVTLVAACYKYLKDHPGVIFFAAGTRAEELKREVNDLAFDVSLHILFQSKAAHDRYQTNVRHQQFIRENQGNWARVRVFDSYVR